MPTIPTDWPGLKAMGGELFRAMPTLDADGLENGFKAFGLAYLGCTYADDFFGNLARTVEAPALMRIMVKARVKREVELEAEFYRKPLPDDALPYTPVNPGGDYYSHDGTFMNADGTRSIFDDLDE